MDTVAGGGVGLLSVGFLLSRRPPVRAAAMEAVGALAARQPGIGLPQDGALLPQSRAAAGERSDFACEPARSGGYDGGDRRSIVWSESVDKVRQGGKLSEALAQTRALPAMAVRTLRLGEESGQLPMLAGRIADFYDAKLQRSLDRLVGIVGPASIIVISLIVGGLIVSVMTALLSVNQMAQ